jgi:hypothetical protein
VAVYKGNLFNADQNEEEFGTCKDIRGDEF